MSDTKNVKLGVCQIFYKGYDLGYTKGGVEVNVTTEKHEVEIDQFGQTPINELIMGRSLTVTVPMAETTHENMVAIMPGATMLEQGGTAATGTITISVNPTAGDNIVVNGEEVTFVAALTGVGVECVLGSTPSETATNLAAALNASGEPAIAEATYEAAAGVVTVTYGPAAVYGTTGAKTTAGNSFTLAAGTAATDVSVSSATLTGGTNSTGRKVAVTTGVGTDLLSIAGELRLHPINKTDGDLTDDFIVPLAGTAGGLSYAYRVDEERVFNVEFSGYPDPATKVLYKVGGR